MPHRGSSRAPKPRISSSSDPSRRGSQGRSASRSSARSTAPRGQRRSVSRRAVGGPRRFAKGGAVKKKVAKRNLGASLKARAPGQVKKFLGGGQVDKKPKPSIPGVVQRALDNPTFPGSPGALSKGKKSKGRAGRKTLGEASAASRRRGTSKSKRLEKPLDFSKGGGMRKNESEREFLLRTGQRAPAPKKTKRAPR